MLVALFAGINPIKVPNTTMGQILCLEYLGLDNFKEIDVLVLGNLDPKVQIKVIKEFYKKPFHPFTVNLYS